MVNGMEDVDENANNGIDEQVESPGMFKLKHSFAQAAPYPIPMPFSLSVTESMEDVNENANNGIDEQDKNPDSVPSPLLSGTKLNKRFRSKVWDDFIPTFVDGKVAWAECMLCHRILSCSSKTHGTSSLLKHQVSCRSGTQKRPRQQELTSMPYIHKSLVAARSDPKQKKLPFLPSSQKKCSGTIDAMPEQELAFLDTCTKTKRKNQEVDQNESEQNVASPYIFTENNKSLGQIPSPEQELIDTSQKSQKVDKKSSPEELVKILAIHGQSPSIMEECRFNKLVTWLNPIVKMPSPDDLFGRSWCLFKQEKSKLKEKLIALRSRVCLSAYMWHYDSVLAFLCLTVHYIDDDWVKQQNIITFCPLDPSCNSKELSNIIYQAIEEWGIGGKVFSILLDDAFVDDTVASNVKAELQKWNKHAANQSLFVVRYATHLLDHVMQVGLDKLDQFMEKSAKCSKYTMGPTSSVVQYPNHRYAPLRKDWIIAEKICGILGRLHIDMDSMHNSSSPAGLYDKLWDVKNEICSEADFNSAYKDEGFSNVLWKMQQKFKERWELCFFHFCMPMVMDPKYRLGHIKSRMQLFDFESYRNLDSEIDHYIHYVHDTLVSLFYEYSNQVDDSNYTSGSKTSKETVVVGDMLVRYYHETEYPYGTRPLTELDQYLQEPCLITDESSVLQWWKKNNLTYPTIARMARDILALPCCTDHKMATRTARIAMSEFGNELCIERLVCAQDWLKTTGTTTME
ncbi:unnamed protein product [Urochloa decumbens]|uniref:BED-type domain-containing protein n=1 Tax=Urochloa decumbens TaxID=240449 RepID=A0ABC9FRY2_9POAL